MRKREGGGSDFADWLRAVDALAPSGEEGLKEIAGLLGLRLREAEVFEVKENRVGARAPRPTDVPPPKMPETAATAEPARVRLESVLVPQHVSRSFAPEWVSTVGRMEVGGPAARHLSIPLEPLFAPQTSRAILSGALATPSQDGPLDLSSIIARLSRGEGIRELPRASIPTLSRGVQVLIDCGEAMQPFAMDQMILKDWLVSVAGKDRTEVAYFEGCPAWGAGKGAQRESWDEYRAPSAGTPVVILTDLGIGRPTAVAGLASAQDWRTFAETIGRAGCPLLALVPYPQRRWPAGLSRLMTIVAWDRGTTASSVRGAVAGGLRVAQGVR